MKAKRQGRFVVKAGQDFPVEVVGTQEIRVTVETAEKKSGMSAKAALVAIVAIFVTGAVAAATMYGVMTDDYSPLKELAESVKTTTGLIMKMLK